MEAANWQPSSFIQSTQGFSLVPELPGSEQVQANGVGKEVCTHTGASQFSWISCGTT